MDIQQNSFVGSRKVLFYVQLSNTKLLDNDHKYFLNEKKIA